MANGRRRVKIPNVRPFFRRNQIVLNLHRLLTNPAGRYSAELARRDRIIQDLENRYQKILREARGTFWFRVFNPEEDTFLFWFKIPSEKFGKDLEYDVLLWFEPTEDSEGNSTISDHRIRVFSNSPNFMFTYAYVLNKGDMLIPLMVNNGKHNRRSLREEPEVRNPVESFGFEKHIWFAAKFIRDHRLINKNQLSDNISAWDPDLLIRSIPSDEEKLNEYQRKSRQPGRQRKRKQN